MNRKIAMNLAITGIVLYLVSAENPLTTPWLIRTLSCLCMGTGVAGLWLSQTKN